MVGFTGSRSLPVQYAALVGHIAAHYAAAGSVATGCAAGADQYVRQAVPGCQVFAVSTQPATAPPRARFAMRSAAMVRAVQLSASPVGLIGFTGSPCPPACKPGGSFAGHGSGTWGTLALAAGLGLPVVVFWCSPHPPALPAWGTWPAVVIAGQLGWQLAGPNQLKF